MTTAQRSSPARRLTEDAAISTAVRALLVREGQSVADLAFHTRISVASLYRKLAGEASWKAADVGAVARHYKVPIGDLFAGKPLGGDRRRVTDGDETRELCAIRDSNPEPADWRIPAGRGDVSSADGFYGAAAA